MGRLSENSVLSIKNKSFDGIADVEVPAKVLRGCMIAQGGRFGGWSLYAKGGNAKFVYNVLGIKFLDVIEATTPVAAGRTQVRMEFAYDGGGPGQGWQCHALLRRQSGGPGPRRPDARLCLLGG